MDNVGSLSVIAVVASFVLAMIASLRKAWWSAALAGVGAGLIILFLGLDASGLRPIEYGLMTIYVAVPALAGSGLGKFALSFGRTS